jgi:putative heme-binding domain-containing protein
MDRAATLHRIRLQIVFTVGLSLAVPPVATRALDTSTEQAKKDRIVVEALLRLENVDVNADAKLKSAVQRHLGTLKDDPSQLKIIQKLKIQGMADSLVERAGAWGTSSNAVQALDLAVEQGALPSLMKQISTKAPDEKTKTLARTLALSNRKDVLEQMALMLESSEASKEIRVEAAVCLSKSKAMFGKLIDLAKEGRIPLEAGPLIGTTLRNSPDESIKKTAQELFPALKTSRDPLPPIEVMVKKVGNPRNGKALYEGVATCSQCHVVGTDGRNVGPNLSEIGSKLARDAMYLAILAPSAGISHNYESYIAKTEDDEVVIGLMVSETADKLILKDAKGIERTFEKKNLAEFKKQEKSLMPENLQETMSEQGLVDLIEYLMTLKKP